MQLGDQHVVGLFVFLHKRIVHPVEEITIAGNLKEMLLNIQAVGRDVHARGAKQTGSILLDRMTVAGE